MDRYTTTYETLINKGGLGEGIELKTKYVNGKFKGFYLQYYMMEEFKIEDLKHLEELIEMLNQARCALKCHR